MKWKNVCVAAAVAMATCLAAADAGAKSRSMIDPGRVSLISAGAAVPAAATPQAVRQAIVDGGKVHGWTVVGEQPGTVTLKVDTRGHQVMVDVAYDATGYEITYKDSVNMNYRAGDDGKVSIHPKYNAWISELGNCIRTAAAAEGIQ